MARWLRRNAWGLAATVLVGSACGPSDRLLWAPPPADVLGAETYVLSAKSPVGLEVFAVATPDGRLPDTLMWPAPSLGAKGQVTFRLLAYPHGLEALGLTEGPVMRDTGRSCRLEQPLSVQGFAVDDDEDWSVQPKLLDPDLAGHFFDGDPCALQNACQTFEMTRLPLETDKRVDSAVRLGPRRFAVATRNGHVYEVWPDDVQRRPEWELFPFSAFTEDGGEDFWYGGQGGELAHGPLGGPYERWQIGTSTLSYVTALERSPDGDEVLATLYLREDDLPVSWVEIYRQVRGGPWESVYYAEIDGGDPGECDIEWLANGRDAVLSYGGPVLLHYINGRIVESDLRTFDIVNHSAGALMARPDGDIYLGSRFGFLFHSVPPFTGFDRVATPIPNTIQAMEPYGDGVLVSGTNGFLGQYYPGRAACDGSQYHWSDAPVLVIGDGVILQAGNHPKNSPEMSSIALLEPVP